VAISPFMFVIVQMASIWKLIDDFCSFEYTLNFNLFSFFPNP